MWLGGSVDLKQKHDKTLVRKSFAYLQPEGQGRSPRQLELNNALIIKFGREFRLVQEIYTFSLSRRSRLKRKFSVPQSQLNNWSTRPNFEFKSSPPFPFVTAQEKLLSVRQVFSDSCTYQLQLGLPPSLQRLVPQQRLKWVEMSKFYFVVYFNTGRFLVGSLSRLDGGLWLGFS